MIRNIKKAKIGTPPLLSSQEVAIDADRPEIFAASFSPFSDCENAKSPLNRSQNNQDAGGNLAARWNGRYHPLILFLPPAADPLDPEVG